MHVVEKTDCPHCAGKGTVRLEDRTYAICGVCAGRGYSRQYQKLTAAQILGMVWRADQGQAVKYAVNSGEGGGDTPTPPTFLRKEDESENFE